MSFINALVNLAKSNLFLRIFSSFVLFGILIFNIYVLQTQNHMWFFYTTIYTMAGICFWELNNIFFKNNIIKSVALTVLNLACLYYINETPYFFMGLFVSSIIAFNIFLSGTKLSIKKVLAYTAYLSILLVAFFFVFFYLIKLPSSFIIDFFLYVFFISVLTDTYAYICGRLLGRHKLAPFISPKKTIEGSVGAIVLTALTGFLVFYLLSFKLSFNYFMMIIILGCVMAQIGDLLESLIKRIAGVKDSSTIIPGHGGVLDRLDSFIFLIFVVQLFLWF